MASKRPASEVFEEDAADVSNKHAKPEPTKKHTLDSDEEDSEDDEK